MSFDQGVYPRPNCPPEYGADNVTGRLYMFTVHPSSLYSTVQCQPQTIHPSYKITSSEILEPFSRAEGVEHEVVVNDDAILKVKYMFIQKG